MKDLVPSIGSSTQTNSASARSGPYSSPMMPCSGKRAAISWRIAASAARSATVTGDRSALSSTAILWRKYGRIPSPAASARSAASARNASSSPTGLLFQAFEIGDDIGPILHLRQAGEAHLGTLGEGLRLVKPDVELVGIPLLALLLEQRRGKLVVRHAGDVLVHDAEQIGADLVGAALLERVALLADFGDLLAVLRIGLGHHRPDRLRPAGGLGRGRSGRSRLTL